MKWRHAAQQWNAPDLLEKPRRQVILNVALSFFRKPAVVSICHACDVVGANDIWQYEKEAFFPCSNERVTFKSADSHPHIAFCYNVFKDYYNKRVSALKMSSV